MRQALGISSFLKVGDFKAKIAIFALKFLAMLKKKTKQIQSLRSETETDYINFEDELFHEVKILKILYHQSVYVKL